MFNVNGCNWISEERNEIKIAVASYGIANLMGLTSANPGIIKNRKWSGTNRYYWSVL